MLNHLRFAICISVVAASAGAVSTSASSAIIISASSPNLISTTPAAFTAATIQRSVYGVTQDELAVYIGSYSLSNHVHLKLSQQGNALFVTLDSGLRRRVRAVEKNLFASDDDQIRLYFPPNADESNDIVVRYVP
ncbi:MAG: hypothetical protein V4508_19640 [Pseudomonadota bacterium]